jgi:hypothetical protein
MDALEKQRISGMKKIFANSSLSVSAVAVVLAFGLVGSGELLARNCVVTNWAGGQTNLLDDNAGTQGSSNRRFAGPCGLRVPVDGTPRYLTDSTPAGESEYIARFYAFLDNAGTDPVILFEADDGTDPQIQVWYNVPSGNDLTLRVFDSGSSASDATFSNVGTGWHSIEFAWESAAAAQMAFSVNGASDMVIDPAPDTSGISIANALLGNVGGAGSSGAATAIDFDEFDSRRTSRPSVDNPLFAGDSNGDGNINSGDITALVNDLLNSSQVFENFAGGQPDCNTDGSVNSGDITCVVNLLLQ